MNEEKSELDFIRRLYAFYANVQESKRKKPNWFDVTFGCNFNGETTAYANACARALMYRMFSLAAFYKVKHTIVAVDPPNEFFILFYSFLLSFDFDSHAAHNVRSAHTHTAPSFWRCDACCLTASLTTTIIIIIVIINAVTSVASTHHYAYYYHYHCY